MADGLIPELEVGRVYTAEELGKIFGFRPYYLRTAGGMVVVREKESLLLITHAGQDASFEYGDRWDENDLIYTGRGQDGHQVLAGPNLDVAENRRKLLLFERCDKYARRFLGRVTCKNYRWGVARDKKGRKRRVLRFRLQFRSGRADRRAAGFTVRRVRGPAPPRARQPALRRPRPFDEAAAPKPPSPGVTSATPEEIAQLREKANAGHHALLVALKRTLEANGWGNIEEIPSAVDLWAQKGALRVLFEVKTITSATELAQTRGGLAQLFEYRFFYGKPADALCLVTDAQLSDWRVKFLSRIGIHVLRYDGRKFVLCGEATSASARALSGRRKRWKQKFR
jgi:hypothetical protein